ncbi:MAG: glutathione S-transferase [Candidatus Endonucleobacter sp. (ex Gigantidas childressi)]|nr:glutathione S-transferase [Candidatus Endonucleobacter sp. (ex Gigantidas childressi)]
MENHSLYPVLYSFRRCPYAIRARFAIKVCNVKVELREVVLADKPDELLSCSPKGTVPVLCLSNGTVIDESLDIMMWALAQNDQENWLPKTKEAKQKTASLIDLNDNSFKTQLNHYKYPDRFPEHLQTHYRQEAEVFLQQLDNNLKENTYLLGDLITLADMAISPFIRQFASVDRGWFDNSSYTSLQKWLATVLASPLFFGVMEKYPRWEKNNSVLIF